MKFGRILLLLVFLGATVPLVSSNVACGPRVVYVRKAPPSPRLETKPPRPGPRAVWIPGHWKWNGREYVWVSGHWEVHPKGSRWIPGHWKKTRHGWKWVPGHWAH